LSPDFAAVVREFDLPGELASADRWGSGHINESYRVAMRDGDATRAYLLQRVNVEVFPDPVALAENIRRVTEHLREKLLAAVRADVDRRVLRLLPTRDGALCHRDAAGGYWRAFPFVEGARTHDVVTSPAMAREAALAFGRFQRDLADLPAPRLFETIPDFHDAPKRFAALVRAVEADAVGRAAGAREEIDLALAREGLATVLVEMPERVTHNDTKVNNVLMDDATGEGICVVDLETTMPGLSLHDFGDLVRSGVSDAGEDARRAGRVRADPVLFEALAEGFLEGTGGLLTPTEVGLMALSGQVMTWLIGIRFLTDHLAGDVYFRTHREGHNLERARAQFALLRSLEEQQAEFERIVERVRSRRTGGPRAPSSRSRPPR
jgi:hypothetical protein